MLDIRDEYVLENWEIVSGGTHLTTYVHQSKNVNSYTNFCMYDNGKLHSIMEHTDTQSREYMYHGSTTEILRLFYCNSHVIESVAHIFEETGNETIYFITSDKEYDSSTGDLIVMCKGKESTLILFTYLQLRTL